MSTINTGGFAFPHSVRLPDGSVVATTYGMSLRDWVAGQALIGLIANYGIGAAGRSSPDELAADAYRAADAMLRAREAKP